MTLNRKLKVGELRKQERDGISSVLSMIVKAGVASGVIAVFCYCFFIVKFFPVGLQLADTLFFLFVALGAGFTGAAISGTGLISLTPWILRKRASPPAATPATTEMLKVSGLLACSALLLISTVLFIGAQDGSEDAVWASQRLAGLICALLAAGIFFILSFYLTGSVVTASGLLFPWVVVTLLLGIALSQMDHRSAILWAGSILSGGTYMASGITAFDGKKARVAQIWTGAAFILISSLVPFVFSGDDKAFAFVFSNVGIRTERATIIVTRSNLNTLQAAADANGVALYACELADDSHAVSGVDILWHGIGQRSYVSLRSHALAVGNGSGVRVELDSSGMKKAQGSARASCMEVRRGIYFASGEHIFSKEQRIVAEPIIAKFLQDADAALPRNASQSLLITGYADPMFEAKHGNPRLARDRACYIYNLAQKQITELHAKRVARLVNACANPDCRKKYADTPAPRVYIDTRIAAGDASCAGKDKSEVQRACFEKDRRVAFQSIETVSGFTKIGVAEAGVACSEVVKAAREY